MGGFKAADAVEALDYDFAPYGPAGTTPEPSRAAMDTFLEQVRQLAVEAGANAPASSDVPDALAGLGDAKLTELSDRMLDLFAGVCQGSPSREALAELPFRIQQVWMGWLLRELTDPTKQSVATTPSLAGSPNGSSSISHAGA